MLSSKRITAALLFAIACIVIASITGCSYERKVEKAKQLVLLNKNARRDIFLKELELNPCANDSSFVAGEIIRYITPSDDFKFTPPVFTDSCAFFSTAAYERGFREGRSSVQIPVRTPDRVTIRDRQFEKLLQERHDSLSAQLESYKQKDVTKSGTIDTLKKERNTWLWRFIGLAVGSGIIMIAMLFLMFKK